MYTRSKVLQQQMFAYVFGKCIVPGMTKRLQPFKEKLFSGLNSMVSNDPNLKDLGPGGIRILEIGIGSGTNLQFYPPNSRLVSLEPNPYFEKLFLENRDRFPHIVVEKFVTGSAENMIDIDDNSIDVVVSTTVLCSVDNLEKVLDEIKRVLYPGGKFYYLEHIGYERGTWGRWFQEKVNPIWKLVNGGCCLTVPISKYIQEAGFATVEEENLTTPGSLYVLRRKAIGIATTMKH